MGSAWCAQGPKGEGEEAALGSPPALSQAWGGLQSPERVNRTSEQALHVL